MPYQDQLDLEALAEEARKAAPVDLDALAKQARDANAEAVSQFDAAGRRVMTVDIPGKGRTQVYAPERPPGAFWPPQPATTVVPGPPPEAPPPPAGFNPQAVQEELRRLPIFGQPAPDYVPSQQAPILPGQQVLAPPKPEQDPALSYRANQYSAFDPQLNAAQYTWREGVVEPAKQHWSTAVQGGANLMHLLGNLTMAINQDLEDMGLGPPEKRKVLKTVENWFREQSAGGNQAAAELAGGRKDFASEVNRAIGGAIYNVPPYVAATAALGGVPGMALVSGLENVDQGPKATSIAALKGAGLGAVGYVLGPAGRPIRLTGNGWLAYDQAKRDGASDEQAWAAAFGNAIVGEVGAPGGGPGVRQMVRNIPKVPGMVAESILPFPVRSTLNPVQQQAVNYALEQEIPLRASQITGNRYFQAMEASTAHTPLGAQAAAEFGRGTEEGLIRKSEELAGEIYPTPVTRYEGGKEAAGALDQQISQLSPQVDAAYQQAWTGVDKPEFTERVQVGTKAVLDAQGKPTGAREPVYRDVNMPVDIRFMKEFARQELPKYEHGLSRLEKSQSKVYNILKQILKDPDSITAQQAEEVLKGFKAESRKADSPELRNVAEGTAAAMIPELQKRIDAAVAKTGKEAVEGLQAGRTLHAEKMDIAEIADKLRTEPVQAFQQLTMGHDAGVDFATQIAERIPGVMPKLARAWLDSLFELATQEGGWQRAKTVFNAWENLGDRTKAILFPNESQRHALDKFFFAAKMIGEPINPSGTAMVGAAQKAGLNPFRWAEGWVGSRLLFTPKGIKFLTGVAQNPPRTPAETARIKAQAAKIFGPPRKPGEPPGNPPGGGEGPPPPPPPGGGGAPGAPPAGGGGIALDDLAESRYGRPYSDLQPDEQSQVIRMQREGQPLEAGFGEQGTLSHGETARSSVAGGPGGELPAATGTVEGSGGSRVTAKRPEGNPSLQTAVNDYHARRGLQPVDHSQYYPVDEAFGRRVADAYESLQVDNSADPKVRAAYEALVRETKEQYDHLIDQGYTLEPWTKEGQPYANSHEMVADLRDNKHLYFFTGGEPHPFLSKVDPDTGLTMNDMFRAVHDAWAHATAGYGFGPRGEEGAHFIHSQSYSPLARQAMSTETRGQNSWVNFGRHNYDAQGNPLNIPMTEKPYAPQKVDLLPEWAQIHAGERAAQAARQAETGRMEFASMGEFREQISPRKMAEMGREGYLLRPGEGKQVIFEKRPAAAEGEAELGFKDLLSRPEDVANQALERIRERGTLEDFLSGERGESVFDPDNLRDVVMVGAGRIVQAGQRATGAVMDFATWSKQMISEFGERIEPHLQKIWGQAKPKADLAMKPVKRRSMEDLDIRIPDEIRAVSQDPTKTVSGQPFHTLDLKQKGEGFLPMQRKGEKHANGLIQRIWREAIAESEGVDNEGRRGSSAFDAVSETGARPPDADFWDKSFSQPQQARYWYELSGESFTGRHVDVPKEAQPMIIDAVAATSGGEKPYRNLERAFGVLSEKFQKLLINTDLRDKESVRKALDPSQAAIESRKYGSFSGTMQRTSGLSTKNPLTTNDVQVGSMFDISGEDIGKNPILYEVLSRFFLKLRDAQNAELGAGAQPWESWQMQAPSWVYERTRKDPTSGYDDYAAVFPRLIKKLQDAGIETPGGKITLETLMDPRTPNVMSATREQFLKSPIATVEVATELTPWGKKAADTYRHLAGLDPEIAWVRNAKAEYEQNQVRTMRDLAMRMTIKKGASIEQIKAKRPWEDDARLEELQKEAAGRDVELPSIISDLMSAVVGRPVEVTRIDWNGYGTYKDQINPNLRIPLTGRQSDQLWRDLNEVERKAFLAHLGKYLHQDGMAASHFAKTTEGAPVPKDRSRTYSVFLERYDGVVEQDRIREFSRQIGFPVSVSQSPNGMGISINVRNMKKDSPTLQDVHDLTSRIFGRNPNVKEFYVRPEDQALDYLDREEYSKAIHEHRKGTRSTAKGKADDARGRGKVGDTRQLPSDLERVSGALEAISKKRDANSKGWSKATGERLREHLAKEARRSEEAAAKAERAAKRAARQPVPQ